MVIATGHVSAPYLGGVDDGVGFAKRFGHTIVTPYPSLVQLTSSAKYLKQLSGVKIESRVRCGDIEKQGDVLFTSYGISGLAILDISRVVVQKLRKRKTVKLEIDLMPKMSSEQLISLMKKSLRKKSQKPLEIWLQGFIHKKLISVILEPLGLSKLIESQIEVEHITKIVQQLKSFVFTVNGSRGYKGAEVATGGVDTKEVNPKTMESTKQKGLYLTGEVVDVDGDRGGFNLHFAWVCGMRAGKEV
jgi:predicted Rossmann fold flavoprotein